MAIPSNITSNYTIKAMEKIDKKGPPPKRGARNWAVLYNGKKYPCKLLISWANEYANGSEFNSKLFVTDEARLYLTSLGFTIIRL